MSAPHSPLSTSELWIRADTHTVHSGLRLKGIKKQPQYKTGETNHCYKTNLTSTSYTVGLIPPPWPHLQEVAIAWN